MSLKQLLFGTSVADMLASLGILVLRLGVGLSLAFAHGLGKLPPAERFVGGVEKMGFPAPEVFAWAAGLSEFGGGLLVALGLLTRPAALFAAFTMGVAFFIQHGSDAFERKEKALVFMVALVCTVFTGAGRFSFDAMIGGGKKA
jgi:putative oxidoreductase